MTAITGTVALEENSLSSEYPLTVAVAVTAVGNIVHFLAVSLYHGDICIVPSAITDVAAHKPLAVWAPFKPDVAIRVRIVVLAIEHGAHFLRLQVDDAEGSTILIESHLLAVRTVGRILRSNIGLGELLLFYLGAVSKVLLLLVLDLSLENLPYAIALRSIDQTSAIRSKAQVAFLLRSIGDSLGGLVFCRGNIYITVHHESHLLGIWRKGNLGSTPRLHLADEAWFIVVCSDGDADLLRLCTFLYGIDFAIETIAEQTVIRRSEETDRILLLLGNLGILTACDVAAVDIEGTILLAEIVEALVVGSPYRVAVLALEGSKLLVLSIVEHPDISGDRRSMVLAPCILITLLVVIEHLTVLVDADVLHRKNGIQLRTTALCAYLVNL